MAATQETIERILEAKGLDRRVAELRLVPQKHGIADHIQIFAAVARRLYLPHLVPDFAYIHEPLFYGLDHFSSAYEAAYSGTAGFTRVAEDDLSSLLASEPGTLLVFRTMLGLTKTEFEHSTRLAAAMYELQPLAAGKIDSMERDGTKATAIQAVVAAKTICMIMGGTLFSEPRPGLVLKLQKPDTREGWSTIQRYATRGVPLPVFLHQRHYGGAFRQVLDATSTRRGDILEDDVQALFEKHAIPYIRTGSHNQAEIANRFGVTIKPAPDFVIFDRSETLRALLECKGANDGGTARDKAGRFRNLQGECARLGGIPLVAVLGGMGWARINDALAPVIRDTDGRVFTLPNLPTMLDVSPFPSLTGLPPSYL